MLGNYDKEATAGNQRSTSLCPVDGPGRISELLHGNCKPPAGAGDSGEQGEGADDSEGHGDGGIVERLPVDRVYLREAKDDRDRGDPEQSGSCVWVRELAEVERPSRELVRVDDSQGNGHSYDRLLLDSGGKRAREGGYMELECVP
jgi:hypothetical protein